MNIRPAQIDDIDVMERMGRDFAHAAGQSEIDSEVLRQTLVNLMENGISLVAENGTVKGAIGGLVYPSWFSGELIAQELWWWCDPEIRGTSTALKLLLSLENEAKNRGATRLMMLCLDGLDGDRIANIYTRLGYHAEERTFSKDLN